MIRKLALIGFVMAVLVAAAAYPIASGMTAGAKRVWLITPHADDAVNLNKELFAFDHPEFESQPIAADADPTSKAVQEIMRIYGNPTSEPINVLWVDEAKLIHPTEMPSLTLLPQDKQAGDNVLQVQTVWFFASWVAFGAGGAAILQPAAPPPPADPSMTAGRTTPAPAHDAHVVFAGAGLVSTCQIRRQSQAEW